MLKETKADICSDRDTFKSQLLILGTLALTLTCADKPVGGLDRPAIRESRLRGFGRLPSSAFAAC